MLEYLKVIVDNVVRVIDSFDLGGVVVATISVVRIRVGRQCFF